MTTAVWLCEPRPHDRYRRQRNWKWHELRRIQSRKTPIRLRNPSSVPDLQSRSAHSDQNARPVQKPCRRGTRAHFALTAVFRLTQLSAELSFRNNCGVIGTFAPCVARCVAPPPAPRQRSAALSVAWPGGRRWQRNEAFQLATHRSFGCVSQRCITLDPRGGATFPSAARGRMATDDGAAARGHRCTP